MTPWRVVRVGEDTWSTYRDVRLAMLRETPRAYGSTYAEAAGRTDAEWRAFALGAWLWLAYAGEPADGGDVALGGAVGAVGMYPDPDLPAGSTYLVGMWVHPDHRGRGVADALVDELVRTATGEGFDRLVLDVADENTRAVACYRRLGFRPTGVTGSLPWDVSVSETQLDRRIG